MLALMVASTTSAAAQTFASRDTLRFDLQPQPLAAALNAYSATTGLEILYDSAVVGQRRSSAVQGGFSPAEGLRKLLAGTGLTAVAIAKDAVTIQEPPVARPPVDPDLLPERSAHRSYYGAMQLALEQAFCRDAELQPGDYRAVMTFKIAGDGRINGARLLGTTGSPDRDEKILHALEGLSLESPAPADLAQPIMMVILPRASGTSLECTTAR
ncbi:MAG: hypothetical protein EKK41_24240 [Hyphomicrobiales bacterium]|nr:MAG: hypothetical protein EKK41_24240 [Hyphomicrobiales bacterium]